MHRLSLDHRCPTFPQCENTRLAPIRRPLGKRLIRANAQDASGKSDSALSTLDSLLGESGGPQSSIDRDGALMEWWRLQPRQEAPPRTTSISSAKSPGGRFINNEEMLQNEVWAGRRTRDGQALALPKVSPYISYGLALTNAAVYGTLVRVLYAQGPDAAADMLSGILFTRGAVVEQGELWRVLSGVFVQPDLLTMSVVLYGMLAVAPRVEASLGHRTFVSAVLLSALVAADALIALGGDPTAAVVGTVTDVAATAAAAADAATSASASAGMLYDAVLHPVSQALTLAAAGPSGDAGVAAAGSGLDLGLWLGGLGAAAGIAGCSLAHELTNGDVERKASQSEASTSGNGGGVRSAVRQVFGGATPGALLLAGVGAAALQHVGEVGGGGGGVALAAALMSSFGAGFLLASTAGPRYQVTREVDLPAGSMWIPDPDDVEELTVVVDQTPAIQRYLATGVLALAAGVASFVIMR